MLGVAVEEFAVAGLAGASTVRIATLAGISQAYLFRLFGSKRALFLATYDIVSIRILDSMDEATEGLMGTAAIQGFRECFREFLRDRVPSQFILQTFAASTFDDQIAQTCRADIARAFMLVAERTRAPDDEVAHHLARGVGMICRRSIAA